ncbi:hypothetical protein ASD12_26075 [Mesorhizobium sp. Root102]|nr:hypothetical protein ASD12_26075 [Mesorhizobium sp. Root102]
MLPALKARPFRAAVVDRFSLCHPRKLEPILSRAALRARWPPQVSIAATTCSVDAESAGRVDAQVP